jgi:hypothetical protein
MAARSAALLAALLARVCLAGEGVPPCGTGWADSRALLAMHAFHAGRGAGAAAAAGRGDGDFAGVAVLVDAFDLVARRNPFDLGGRAVRFAPGTRGGYRVSPLEAALEPPGEGLDVALGPREVQLPFGFPFFGRVHDSAFVHGDGSLTFSAPDRGPGAPGLARFVSGPPRIAPFFAPLAPERGGNVSMRLLPDRAAFLWSDVPGAAQLNRNSFAAVLRPDGSVEFVYGRVESREAVVGLSPGAGGAVTPLDLTQPPSEELASGAAERFAEADALDLVSTARRFYAAHADDFDQLVVYATRPMNPLPGSLAFEVNVRNEVLGIGQRVLDEGAAWGSAARLSSVVYMDAVDAYLEVDGFEVLGHEVGHRWLATLRFREGSGPLREELLGRGAAHWSFFLDSDASVLEGNDLEERAGRFESVDVARRFSALDQYAMGLRPPGEVPPFFYVAGADDFRPDRPYKVSSQPELGVSFTGRARAVRIEDVIAAMGPRRPPQGPRPWRIAFVLVADEAGAATAARVGALAHIRTRFESWFQEATDWRGLLDTRLR